MTDIPVGSRQAVLSPFQRAGLRGFLEGYQEGHEAVNRYLETLSKVASSLQEAVAAPTPAPSPISLAEARTLVYTSLLQAGVSRLELSFADSNEMPTEKYLRDRLLVHRGPEFAEIFMVVNFAFRSHLPDFDSPQQKNARYLALDVFDLLFALRRGKSMVNIFSRSRLEETVRTLPARLGVPLGNLFASMTLVKPEVVVPRSMVDVDNLALLQEILAETAFAAYERAQAGLELSDAPLDDGLALVRKAATKLCSKTKRVLRLQRVVAAVLPASKGLIDKGLGKLPGKLADVAVAAAEPWFKSKRQLVVYEIGPSLRSLVGGRRIRDVEESK